jgi:hypothetical protein
MMGLVFPKYVTRVRQLANSGLIFGVDIGVIL